MADNRDTLIIRAKLAEETERFEEMVSFMKDVIKKGNTSLTPENRNENRNLLSVAYKNVIGAKRSSWRIISAVEQKLEGEENKAERLKIAQSYKTVIEKELQNVIDDIIELLDSEVLPPLKDAEKESAEEKAFYYKMKGDYCRYNAEFVTEEEKRKEIVESASLAYKTAKDTAEEHLSPTNPIRLGLVLNYSVFFYEIKNSPEDACKIAKHAFDTAIADLDTLNEESYKDSTLIMQLLRDNLTLWTADAAESSDPQ